ncbi:MAG TPA: acyltransferase domain-containing protein, partial [Ktedonobacteraceae bacterium]|nr:acyltransferase domain-containing protein [Ktedonobacteraceae bacterium]
MFVCRNRDEALAALEAADERHIYTAHQAHRNRPVAFLFPGVGEQYPGMARELYEKEAVFRSAIDRAFTILKTKLDLDLTDIFFSAETSSNGHNGAPPQTLDLRSLLGRSAEVALPEQARLKQTEIAQPLVFVVEYALAQLLFSWGIRPSAMLGYSLGEYVAACLSGVLSLEDALTLVAGRARLIAQMPAGAMLAVALSEAEIQAYLQESVNLAVINAPGTCVLAGPEEAICEVQERLQQRGVACRRVETTHAFHSAMLQPVQEPLRELVRQVSLQAPRLPYLSNVTGSWITEQQATDPAYWSEHLCQTVRFADGVANLLQESARVILEVGPGQALGSFVKQHPACDRERFSMICSTQLSQTEMRQQSEYICLLTTLARLWLLGVPIDWKGYYAGERRHRVLLPTYPFERQRYWIEVDRHAKPASYKKLGRDGELKRTADIGDWFFLPSWKQSLPSAPFSPAILSGQKRNWLVFGDTCGIGERLIALLVESGQSVVTVLAGAAFARKSERTYTMRPGQREDYGNLLTDLSNQGIFPTNIIHLWSLTSSRASRQTPLNESLDKSFYSLFALAQGLGDLTVEDTCQIAVISNELHNITGNERVSPEKATLTGPCRVISQEYATLNCRSIDIYLPEGGQEAREASQLLGEIVSPTPDNMVALRGNTRWVQAFEPAHINELQKQNLPLRKEGVYLITGGLGGLGLALAEYLAQTYQARLVLVGRSGLPEREAWQTLLEAEGSESDVALRIRRVQEMEAVGSRVLTISADVTSEAQMRVVVQQALATFG